MDSYAQSLASGLLQISEFLGLRPKDLHTLERMRGVCTRHSLSIESLRCILVAFRLERSGAGTARVAGGARAML